MADQNGKSLQSPANVPSHAGVQAASNPNILSRQLELVADGMARMPEAMRFLGIGKSLLYELMEQGELPFVKIGGCLCIPRVALAEFAAKRLVQRPRD